MQTKTLPHLNFLKRCKQPSAEYQCKQNICGLKDCSHHDPKALTTYKFEIEITHINHPGKGGPTPQQLPHPKFVEMLMPTTPLAQLHI